MTAVSMGTNMDSVKRYLGPEPSISLPAGRLPQVYVEMMERKREEQ